MLISTFFHDYSARNIVCPCQSLHPRRNSLASLIDPRVFSLIRQDAWFQNFESHLLPRTTTPSLIYFPFYPDMIRDSEVGNPNRHLLITHYELQHFYNNYLEIRPTPFRTAGKGVYVRKGVTLPKNFVIPFWGVVGHLYNRCISNLFIDRQVQIENSDKEPIRFFTHPSCVAGYVNSASPPLSTSPNCMLWFNYDYPSLDLGFRPYHFIHPSSFLYLKTTKSITGDGSEESQLLFQYSSLRKEQIRKKKLT